MGQRGRLKDPPRSLFAVSRLLAVPSPLQASYRRFSETDVRYFCLYVFNVHYGKTYIKVSNGSVRPPDLD